MLSASRTVHRSKRRYVLVASQSGRRTGPPSGATRCQGDMHVAATPRPWVMALRPWVYGPSAFGAVLRLDSGAALVFWFVFGLCCCCCCFRRNCRSDCCIMNPSFPPRAQQPINASRTRGCICSCAARTRLNSRKAVRFAVRWRQS